MGGGNTRNDSGDEFGDTMEAVSTMPDNEDTDEMRHTT